MSNNNEVFFITGTDTNIGKTTSTIALLKHFNKQNNKTIGLKPVATDSFYKQSILYNNDALLLQKHSSIKASYDDINPYRFAPPVSPHLVNKNNAITSDIIASHCHAIIAKHNPDYCFIEGAGGWYCPLSERESFADIVKALDIPVILIIGIKLGCLNHAILTTKAIQNNNIKIHSWIANCLSSDNESNSNNIQYLKRMLNIPMLGQINFCPEQEPLLNTDL